MPFEGETQGFAGESRCLVALAALLLLAAAPAAATLSAEEAAHHVGETATVCGTVASARFAERSRAQPTFLNLGKPYPDQLFTIVIFGRDREKFGTPESTLLHQRVCATGAIKLYEGRPEMIVEDPAQLGKSPR
ncbi:MAG TPA: hypothetical protein VEI03_16940 [Stellaceae bacterium]|nr:hypothetical protein [Stellaceae bacterium]